MFGEKADSEKNRDIKYSSTCGPADQMDMSLDADTEAGLSL